MFISRLSFISLLLLPTTVFARRVCGVMSAGIGTCNSTAFYNSVDVLNGKEHRSTMLIMIVDQATCSEMQSGGLKYYCVDVELTKSCFPGGNACGNIWVPRSQFVVDEARTATERARMDAEDKAYCAAHRNGTGICVR